MKRTRRTPKAALLNFILITCLILTSSVITTLANPAPPATDNRIPVETVTYNASEGRIINSEIINPELAYTRNYITHDFSELTWRPWS